MIEIRQYFPGDKNAVWTLHNEALAGTGAHGGNGPWDDDQGVGSFLVVE